MSQNADNITQRTGRGEASLVVLPSDEAQWDLKFSDSIRSRGLHLWWYVATVCAIKLRNNIFSATRTIHGFIPFLSLHFTLYPVPSNLFCDSKRSTGFVVHKPRCVTTLATPENRINERSRRHGLLFHAGDFAGRAMARGRYRRQREYPQPPPPSKNNTRITINTVSIVAPNLNCLFLTL